MFLKRRQNENGSLYLSADIFFACFNQAKSLIFLNIVAAVMVLCYC